MAIGKIRKLYAIEKRIEKLPPEEKTRQRQQLAQPVLDDLKAWLEKNSTRVPRDSLTYKAIQYTLNQWELLKGQWRGTVCLPPPCAAAHRQCQDG